MLEKLDDRKQQYESISEVAKATRLIDDDKMKGYDGDDNINGVDGVQNNDRLDGGPNTDTCTSDPDTEFNCEAREK